MEVCIRRISMVVVAILDVKLEQCGLIKYNMYYPQNPLVNLMVRWRPQVRSSDATSELGSAGYVSY